MNWGHSFCMPRAQESETLRCYLAAQHCTAKRDTVQQSIIQRLYQRLNGRRADFGARVNLKLEYTKDRGSAPKVSNSLIMQKKPEEHSISLQLQLRVRLKSYSGFLQIYCYKIPGVLPDFQERNRKIFSIYFNEPKHESHI